MCSTKLYSRWFRLTFNYHRTHYYALYAKIELFLQLQRLQRSLIKPNRNLIQWMQKLGDYVGPDWVFLGGKKHGIAGVIFIGISSQLLTIYTFMYARVYM